MSTASPSVATGSSGTSSADVAGGDTSPILFVGNISAAADGQYLQRLFSAYGHVRDVRMEGSKYALVTLQTVDDADCAIAALHLRYCMAPKVPILVLYSNASPKVSEYGRQVNNEFRIAAKENRQPSSLALPRFDPAFDRGTVQLPPSEIAPLLAWRQAPPVSATAFAPGLFP